MKDANSHSTATEQYVQLITQAACPQVLLMAELIQVLKQDSCLERVKVALHASKWVTFLADTRKLDQPAKDTLEQLWRLRVKLWTTSDGLILQGWRIVVPWAMQDLLVKLAHQGH